MNSEESLQSQKHLEDHQFREVLYNKLKDKLSYIDYSIFEKHSIKLRELELKNYQAFRKCIEPLSFSQDDEFLECQTEFKKKDVTSFVSDVVKSSKDKLYHCLNNSYLVKKPEKSDIVAIDGCLNEFDTEVEKIFKSQ